ncbi:peptidoglycan DD-metalloendopeptidase family protein, partial [Microbacterium hominis]|uniref:M23 family metallopeptidase n=1 Tax=Microbacterium hominis TaxID=162426 RepID=UPI000A72CC32
MLAGTVMFTDAPLAALPLLITLTPEPVFAVEATRTPVRAQSFTTPDTVTETVMVRGDYTVAVTGPAGTESYAHTADTFTNDPASAVQWPFTVGVPISSTFGYRTRPCPCCSNFHAGLDMTPGIGTPIQAIADGVVTTATEQGGAYGVYVVI